MPDIIKSPNRLKLLRISFFLLAGTIVFCCGFYTGQGGQATVGTFHDMIVNHPHHIMTLITPSDKRVMELSTQLKTPENAFAYVRDSIRNNPSLPALPAGEMIAEGQASCLGKAIVLCSLYRAMGFAPAAVRIVTGDVDGMGGIIDHAWLEIEYKGICLQQDSTDLLGVFTFDQFKGTSYVKAFIRDEEFVFNDKHFATVSSLNQLKGMGHPQVH